ncbi:hypothetical protein KI387_002494 [Taxus chinensis]|uniref:mitogen-activated protein kinase kinase n=1 Tax=Taxus chinensis TaxID=29808 RepID=A0AA38GXH2_TAXCH|nr:hypothetical protein KI387_002494 [Taxus chinensis]
MAAMSAKKRFLLKTEISIPKRPPLLPPVLIMAERLDTQRQLSEFEKVGILGQGSEGIVYKLLHRSSSSFHALNVVRLRDEASQLTKQIHTEARILEKIHSPYVVKCDSFFVDGGNMSFLLEYMDGGSLANFAKQKNHSSEPILAKIAEQVLQGLKYLHHEKIVHRDIKPSNLLINRNSLQVKITDFGVRRIVSRQDYNNTDYNSYVGTCAYMSPERLDPDGSYGGNGSDGDGLYAGDIWSLGVTMLECYMGYFPFLPPGQNPDWAALMFAISIEDLPSLPPTASPQFQSFINSCLQKEVSRRWTASQLLDHPFVNGSLSV